MGCCAYRPLKKQINELLKPMLAYPKNPAMQGLGCQKLLDLLHQYEAPHVMIKLMGPRTTLVVCRCVKTHYHSGIVMRSAADLLAELCKDPRNLKRVRKQKVLHKLQQSSAEFPHDKTIAKAATSVEAALRGIYKPYETLETAIDDLDADLIMLIMKSHPDDEQVQADGSQGIVAISREDDESRQRLYEKGAIKILVSAMAKFPKNDHVLSNAAGAFREMGRDIGANREVGRAGGIHWMCSAMNDHSLWRETHQAILWALSILTAVETNIIHMKAAKMQYVLNELKVRKEAVYSIKEEERVRAEARRELAELERKYEHKAEDEYEKANPHARFDFDKTGPPPKEEPSAFENFKANLEAGKPLYQRKKGEARKFLTEAEELAYVAKKRRLQQLLQDGSPAADDGGIGPVGGGRKKRKAASVEYELAGKGQRTALFVPQKLRNIEWSKYADTLEGLKKGINRADADLAAPPVEKKSYEATLNLLLGEEAAKRRAERKRKPRVVPTSEQKYQVHHATRSGAYVG